MDDLAAARETIRRWFTAGIEVVEPRQAVANALILNNNRLEVDGNSIALPVSGRVIVISIGKAAASMAQGAYDVLGDRIDAGIILTKHGHLTSSVPGFRAFEAGHPVPDHNSVSATIAILDAVKGLTGDDLVLALVSGGGSALLESPVDGVSLEDMRTTTRVLMHAGAGIHDLNRVRRLLSRVKGGGLRRAMVPASCVTLLLSDVLGNDPAVIASGPTVIASADNDSALQVIDRFGVRANLPDTVLDAISRPQASHEDIDTTSDVVTVVADNETFVSAIVKAAEVDGLTVSRIAEPYEGDAAELGKGFMLTAKQAPCGVDVIVRGGEATVEVTGDGVGGRNTEMALAAGLSMRGDDQWVIASLASDGDDGNSNAAGAIADGQTATRAGEVNLDPSAALDRNDSATVFRAVGGIIETGPTGTNVNDVYIALRRRAIRGNKI